MYFHFDHFSLFIFHKLISNQIFIFIFDIKRKCAWVLKKKEKKIYYICFNFCLRNQFPYL